MMKEIKELVHRNLGNTFDTEIVLNQLIQIYAILKTDDNINQSFRLLYENMAFHLQMFKTQLQKENKIYEENKRIL